MADGGRNLLASAFSFTSFKITFARRAPGLATSLWADESAKNFPSLWVTEALHRFPFGRTVHCQYVAKDRLDLTL